MVHEVDAPDGSGCLGLVSAGAVCLGLVPEVEVVGEECGVLEVVDMLEPVSGGATGGAAFATGAAVVVIVGSKGWSLGTNVQLY